MGLDKYCFAIKTYGDKVIVRVTLEDKWINDDTYSNRISEELKRTMDYLGYDYVGDDWHDYEEFQKESTGESIDNIVTQLNKYPLLDYNEDFKDFVLTNYYCVYKNPNGGFRLFVVPKTFWDDNSRHEDKPADAHINRFLTSVGFIEEYDGIFRPTTNMDEDEIFKIIEDFEYLQYSGNVYDFVNMSFR